MLEFHFNKVAGPKAITENYKQQQLSEGFANICYKIVSSILLRELINDFAEHFYLLKM